MELVQALTVAAGSHPFWLAGLSALCGLFIGWRWHQETASLRSRALRVLAASATPVESWPGRYVMVIAVAVATTLLVGQVGWGRAVSVSAITPAPTVTPEPSPAQLDVDGWLRRGATIDIHLAPSATAVIAPTSAPTAAPSPTPFPSSILIRPKCTRLE